MSVAEVVAVLFSSPASFAASFAANMSRQSEEILLQVNSHT